MTIPLDISFGAIGKPLQRKEDARLLTGRGRFSDDFSVDGETHAAIVRSPHPHARIVGIDTGAVFTGRLTALRLEDGSRKFLQT